MGWTPGVTLALSAVATIAAVVGLKQLSLGWATIGAVAGALSFALLGLGTLFSLIALGFLAVSRVEGEAENLDTARLTVDDWPDKSLAASLLLFMAGVVALVWGFAILSGSVSFGSASSNVFGLL